MIFFNSSAFNFDDNIINAVGNPANVVIFTSKENMNDDTMSKIAYNKFPITVFLQQRGNINEFDLRFYTKDGKEFGLCGHGTICAAGVINAAYKNLSTNISFHLSDARVIEASLGKNQATIKFPTTDVELLKNKITAEKLCEIFNIKETDVANIYQAKSIRDYIIYLKDPKTLRNIKPNLDLLLKYSAELNSRIITIFSDTNFADFNIEVRVFSHLIVGKNIGDGEDVACGSANCSIAPILNKDSYKTLFPYQYNELHQFGGVQMIEYDKKNKSIKITGGFKVEEL